MAATRFDWSTTAQGARVVPILLLAGMPYILTPAGSGITAISPSGTLDARWWPGTGATHAGKLRAWLDVEGLSWSERLEPLSEAQLVVSSLRVRVVDLDLAATVAFQSQENLTRTAITAEVAPADTTISVVDTSAFASSGTLYLNREAIDYSGKTGTSFTGCTRARLGSRAQRHPLGGSGVVLGSPDVTTAPQDVDGRLATLWLATLSADGTTITAVELEYCGVVGQGPVLDEDGAAYVLDLDPAIKALSQKLPTRTVTVGGYVHAGNNGRLTRNPTAAPPPGGYGLVGLTTTCPMTMLIGSTTTAGLIDYAVVLGNDTTSGDPDNGGWHPSAESFLADWNRGAAEVAGNIAGTDYIVAQVAPSDGRVVVRAQFGTARDFSVYWPWSGPPSTSDASTDPAPAVSSTRMPEAWVPIRTESRVYLSADDYGLVPAVPTGLATGVEALWALRLKSEFEGASRDAYYHAAITAKTTASPQYYLTVRALPRYLGSTAIETTEHVVRSIQDATLDLYVRAPTWVDALYALVVSVSSDLAESMPDAVDWDDLATVRDANPGPFPVYRERVWDVENILAELRNEATLNGLTLAVRRGLLTMVRAGEYAPTETTVAAITSAGLSRGDARPRVDRGAGGIANTFELTDPARNATYRAVDRTSLAHFGAGQTLRAKLPPGATASLTLAQAAQATYQLGGMLLAPHRRPTQTVTIAATLALAGVQLGDLIDASLWSAPSQTGTRGITSRVVQVVGRAPRFFDGGAGGVSLTLRLQPQNLQGYASSALIAAGGISGAVCTLDTSTFGTRGCASPLTSTGATRTDGGASTFAAGDKVRLVELDNASPTATTQHTVVSTSGDDVTLNPAPSATFATLAASAIKVALVFDDYATSTTTQREYAYLADHSWVIVAGVRARVFGA